MLPDDVDREALWEADELVFEAQDHPDRQTRIELAERALEVSLLCSDAYNLLAAETRGKRKRIALYRQGMEAGERALGVRTFSREVGEFWSVLETRPYMRSRFGLAEALWAAGGAGSAEREEAIGHYEALLCLSANDNLGVRHVLVPALIEADRADEASSLLARYSEDSAWWTWSDLLVRYREGVDEDGAFHEPSRPRVELAMRRATETNPDVADYLTGAVRMPRELPAFYGHGSEEEAILYAARSRAAWDSVPGAIDWLRKVEAQRP